MTVASLVSRFGQTVSIRRKATDTLDSSGGRVEAWSTVEAITGYVQVRANSDAVAGGAERSTQVATIYFEGRPTVRVRDRITYGSVTFEISSVRVPDERPISDALCYTIVEATEVFG